MGLGKPDLVSAGLREDDAPGRFRVLRRHRTLSNEGNDVLEKAAELATLRRRSAAPVAHDHPLIAQLRQASEVIENVCLGPGAGFSASVRTSSRLADGEEELMAQAEVGHASPVRLAQLLEPAQPFTQALGAQPGGDPTVPQVDNPPERRI